MNYLIEVDSENVKSWMVLYNKGNFKLTQNLRIATKMTFPEAWNVLRWVQKDIPNPPCNFTIVVNTAGVSNGSS